MTEEFTRNGEAQRPEVWAAHLAAIDRHRVRLVHLMWKRLQDDTPPDALIGYTEFRTDLPGGRHANVKTRRAVVVKADGTGRRVLAEELTRVAGSPRRESMKNG
jgi:hypothetical protein